MNLHLDGQLSIQTKRRFVSSSPTTPEQLRLKYKVLANCWLMGQMRQPGRHLFSDLEELRGHQEYRTESRHPPRLVSLHGLRARIEEECPSAGQGERIPNPARSVGCLQRPSPQARELLELLQAGHRRSGRIRQPYPAAPCSEQEAREESRRFGAAHEIQVSSWKGLGQVVAGPARTSRTVSACTPGSFRRQREQRKGQEKQGSRKGNTIRQDDQFFPGLDEDQSCRPTVSRPASDRSAWCLFHVPKRNVHGHSVPQSTHLHRLREASRERSMQMSSRLNASSHF